MPDYKTHLRSNLVRLAAVDALLAKLETTASGTPALFVEAARNLRLEQSLDKRFWNEIADYAIARGLTQSLSENEQEIVRICRSFTRAGKPVSTLRTYHGRAIKGPYFVDTLVRQGLPKTRAQKIVARLPALSASDVKVVLRYQDLGGHGIMWSTYCEDCDCNDPFHPRSVDAELIDALGLPFVSRDQFLLFTYRIPKGVTRHRPTAADAYGGEFYFAYRTNEGRTHPIRYPDRLNGRPEVVHRAIKGSHLSKSVELARPKERDVRRSRTSSP
jgi:hypothetical protein